MEKKLAKQGGFSPVHDSEYGVAAMSGAENLRMLMFALQQDLTNEFLKRLLRRVIQDVPGFKADAFLHELKDYAADLDEAHGGSGRPLPSKGLASEMWLEKIELVASAIEESRPGGHDGIKIRDGR